MIAKLDVRLDTLRPELLLLEPIVDDVYSEFKASPVVTSTNDGKHKRGSLHYRDAAFDLRVRHIKDVAVRWDLWKALRDRVYEKYPGLYDVLGENLDEKILRKDGKPSPYAHIHVELSPEGCKWANVPSVETNSRVAGSV